jgi:hypothetical protein
VSLMKQELLTLPEHMSSPPVFSGLHVVWSLFFCVVLCRSLFVLFPFLVWSLGCLSFFDLRILITPLVSWTYWEIFIFREFSFHINICLSNNLINQLVPYNDSYIDVIGSFTFAILNMLLNARRASFHIYNCVSWREQDTFW